MKNKEAKLGHGGSRPGCGRKPLAESEKKVPLVIYVRQAIIDSVGGADVARNICIESLSKY